MQLKSMAAVALASGIVSSSMAADAVQWRVEDGGNGHWYRTVVHTQSLSWESAKSFSQQAGGHLVSITSALESDFVADVARVPSAFNSFVGPWLGGFQDRSDAAYAEPNGGWRWVTGEPWYSEWQGDEPNNGGTGEDYLMYAGTSPQFADLNWNDFGPHFAIQPNSFIVEWSADCNNDGIVDFGQCRDGSLPDYNGNNIPDCCEQGTTCVLGSYPVQWRTEDGGNGHWYQMRDSGQPCFLNAIAYAESIRGYLMTANSHAEWTFASRYARAIGRPGFTIGAKGPQLAGGDWAWVTGEPWSYTAWGGQGGCAFGPYPNNGASGYYMWTAACGSLPDNVLPWDDGVSSNQCQSSLTVLIEWSADCNADGIVDHGQILGGELADTNANGVPDTCESTLLVPSQFPTIQAAIDSVPAGAQRTVQVAAGTYNESFSLNGKNVVIRGAANNATILDGTGLTTSIARFTGGEPASAGVEQLVFRNGTAGSRFTSKSNFTVGGAIYATDTAARIARCRFENCSADFGGAVYQKTGVLAWDDCVFVGNAARSEGGAVLVYNCTGIVRGCSFTTNRCGLLGPGSGSAFKSVGSNGEGESVVLDSCTITANVAGDSGSAVEHYEHTEFHPGVLRIVNTVITGNTSGQPTPVGAGGLRVLGRMQSCVIGAGSQICDNLARDIDGPYFIEGSPTICDCSADITRDDVVNGGDLGVLLSNWGVAGTNGLGDVTHDGMVDGGDLAVVLSSWGTCP